MADSENSTLNTVEWLAEFDEVLSTARSVRRKLDFERVVPHAVLLECIDVAVQAPTGAGGENWRFIIVDADDIKQQIAVEYRAVLEEMLARRGLPMKSSHQALIERMPHIPALIFVCMDGLPVDDQVSTQVAYYGSILPAGWSLMLALRARGIGATWTTLLSARQDAIRTLLGMPKDALQLVMLPVGYTKNATLKRAQRQPAQTVTTINGW